MAIAYVDANAANSATSSTSTSITASGSNTIVIAVVGGLGGATTVSSITCGGNAMTLVNSNASGSDKQVWVYYALAASGSTTVAVTLSTGTVSLAVACYSGAKQIAPEASNVGAVTASDITDSVTTLTDNAWVVMGVATNQSGGSSFATSTGWTKRAGGSSNHEATIGDSNAAITPTASTSATAHYVSGSAGIVDVILSIAPKPLPVNSTLALGQGSFTLSGQSLALHAAYKLVLAVGSFALTGFTLAFSLFRLWANQTKDTSSFSNSSRNSSSWSNQTKDSSSFTNQSKP